VSLHDVTFHIWCAMSATGITGFKFSLPESIN